jgi:alanine racemase
MNFEQATAAGFFEQATPLFDSRKMLLSPEKYIFFALATPARDGHQFIIELYARGVRRFVVAVGRATELQNTFADALFLAAEKPLQILQKWAAAHRQKFTPKAVLAITGSNAKTIVKEWLYQLLEPLAPLVKSPQSYNSQIGVPLSVLALAQNHQYAIFEAGISQVGEMENLAKIIKPNIGLFTNIGAAHSEGFSSKAEKAKEKAKLFTHCETIFYNGNSDLLTQILAETCPNSQRIAIKISSDDFGENWNKKNTTKHDENTNFENKANLANQNTIEIVAKSENNSTKTTLKIDWKNQISEKSNAKKSNTEKSNAEFILPFNDVASVENAAQAIVIALYLGLPTTGLNEKLAALRNVAMRLEQKQGANNCQIIDDTYTNDLQAMFVALDFMRRQARFARRTVVFSAYPYANENDFALFLQSLQQAGVKRLICVGDLSLSASFFTFSHNFAKNNDINFLQYADTAAILAAIQVRELVFERETILLKGSRAAQFERVVLALQQQKHDTELLVNLSAIAHNFQFYRRLLRPTTKTMAMVKAFAYGSGSSEVAQLLAAQGVDYLGVAYPNEGISLRKDGILQPILVMNVSPEAYILLLEYDLEPVIYSWKSLRDFTTFLAAEKRQARIHLEIDTGMRRLGFDTDIDTQPLFEFLANHGQYLEVASIFSHLATAEAAQHDDFTREQIAKFSDFTAAYTLHFQPQKPPLQGQPLRHLLNSAGAMRWHAEGEFDMVRLGICLHGIGAKNLQPVAQWQTIISQIRQLLPSETVGYGRAGKTEKPTRIATIAIGYADGFRRAAGNGRAKVWINGHFCPTFGNICMDMAFIDLGEIAAQEGDRVVIFGAQNPIENLAAALDTIPYELLTNVGMRIPRIFYED